VGPTSDFPTTDPTTVLPTDPTSTSASTVGPTSDFSTMDPSTVLPPNPAVSSSTQSDEEGSSAAVVAGAAVGAAVAVGLGCLFLSRMKRAETANHEPKLDEPTELGPSFREHGGISVSPPASRKEPQPLDTYAPVFKDQARTVAHHQEEVVPIVMAQEVIPVAPLRNDEAAAPMRAAIDP